MELMGEGMECMTHPYSKNQGGNGICALCLREKLSKLVTSSFPLPKPTSLSSSSTSTSFRAMSLSLRSNVKDSTNNNNNNNLQFLLAKKKKMLAASSSASSSSSSTNLIYKRSKSTGESFSQRKRSGFWSFLHLYSSKTQISTPTKNVHNFSHLKKNHTTTETPHRGIDMIVEEEDEKKSPSKVVEETPRNDVVVVGGSSFGRKVLRSRSVGHGSRSFSSDCALRRIESQREPTKVISNNGGGGGSERENAMSNMVKCGGIFGGFMIMTPSSSSTPSIVDHHSHKMGNKSWGWAFASPMRANKTTTNTEAKASKNTSLNLNSIPSLLH